ncbi:hypothetical protein [Piscirickettsia salmonis]|uniref:hypothetical protein n=1 Tax=Piscirickettsia salmonis TaxID=1238 RepID=UPI003A80F198
MPLMKKGALDISSKFKKFYEIANNINTSQKALLKIDELIKGISPDKLDYYINDNHADDEFSEDSSHSSTENLYHMDILDPEDFKVRAKSSDSINMVDEEPSLKERVISNAASQGVQSTG